MTDSRLQVMQGHFGYGMKALMREISEFMTRSAAKKQDTGTAEVR